ncbi:hypothetical protein ABFX02_14G220900 [Erythranthe guttata]
MLHLRHCTCLSPNTHSSLKKKKSIFLSGFGVSGDNELLGFKNRRRNGPLNGVEKDSGFEVDPDKAREALRQLDEQLQSFSKRKVSPPKNIRAMDYNEPIIREREEEISGFTGSFLVFAASGLLVFTILYNIIFFTVIKPSVDGPETVESASTIMEAEKGASIKRLSKSAEFSIRR